MHGPRELLQRPLPFLALGIFCLYICIYVCMCIYVYVCTHNTCMGRVNYCNVLCHFSHSVYSFNMYTYVYIYVYKYVCVFMYIYVHIIHAWAA